VSWYNSSSYSSRNKERYDTLATIDEFLNKVSHVKKAASRKGETTHPSKDVPDNTHRVQLGERFEEHKEDVEEHLGDEANTTSNTEVADAKVAAVRRILHEYKKLADSLVRDAKEVATDGGMKVTPTGEDPEHETESTKDTKDDPGTEHPANTENEDLNGGKYASYRDLPVEKLASLYKELADKICYRIAHGIAEEVKTAYDAAHNLAYQTVSQTNPTLDNLLLNSYLKKADDERAILEQLEKKAAEEALLEQLEKEAAEEALLKYLLLNDQQKFNKEAQPMMPPIAPAGIEAAADLGPVVGGGGGGESEAAITPDMLASVPPEVMMSDTSVPVENIPTEPVEVAGGGSEGEDLAEQLQSASPEEIAQAVSELPPEVQEIIEQEIDKELQDAGAGEAAEAAEKQSFDLISEYLLNLLSAEKQAEDEVASAQQLEEMLDNVTPEQIGDIVDQLNPQEQEVLLQELINELGPEVVQDAVEEKTSSSSDTSSDNSSSQEEKQSFDINAELLNLLREEIIKQSADAALNELNLKKKLNDTPEKLSSSTPPSENIQKDMNTDIVARAMVELGITPEELQKAITNQQEESSTKTSSTNKTAHNAVNTMNQVNNMKAYIKELINRSRGIYE
jgi:hypothetical protein